MAMGTLQDCGKVCDKMIAMVAVLKAFSSSAGANQVLASPSPSGLFGALSQVSPTFSAG